MNLDVLVFAAHPDDAELSMGGTIARFTAQGLKVGVVDLTKAELSTRGNVITRAKETAAASKILKLKVRENLGIEDGGILSSKDNLKRVITIIRKFKPSIVFAPYFNDRHPDHIDASILVKRAVFSSGLEKYRTAIAGKSQLQYRPKKIFYYMQTYIFEPTFIVDVSDYFETKMKSCKAFNSQFHNPSLKKEDTFISKPEFLDYVKARAEFYGFQIRKKYGEPFYCEENIEYDFSDLL
ncbi:MAG: bacillithiol biosynthesis deacetylase BshB1 [Ignavibacteriaceae bacterium]|jgi:bacillithiol biosynthesis deacetylase BshB1|nr:bacillithiol biosynthesis deacetylase BshB1 [Ignavibacteriaceae bacterium]